jgi:hypothetical protein
MKRFIQVSVFIVIALALVIATFSFAYAGTGIAAEKAGIDTGLNSVSIHYSVMSPAKCHLNSDGNDPNNNNNNNCNNKKPNVGWNS